MRKKWGLCLAIALAVVFSLMAASCTGPAGPAGPPGPQGIAGPAGPAGSAAEASQASIVIVPMSGPAGTKLTVYGSGFAAGENVRVFLNMEGTRMVWGPAESGGIVKVNAYGAFQLIPAGGIPTADVIKPGVYSVEAIGDKGSQASTPLAVTEKK